ncbi:MAG: SDR family NAD(P)-dependent oxidoreductase, partial [Betaproteobacteria bacterium]|nr:SDR family NAD(P)-dependent oxidoreductase [Betaproteobacteria bacterium]
MQTISNQPSNPAKPLAWITGGATGIGLASAIALGQAGFRVVVSGRRQAELQSAQQQLQERSIEAYAMPLDVADPQA